LYCPAPRRVSIFLRFRHQPEEALNQSVRKLGIAVNQAVIDANAVLLTRDHQVSEADLPPPVTMVDLLVRLPVAIGNEEFARRSVESQLRNFNCVSVTLV
jgi:hypothetical protein